MRVTAAVLYDVKKPLVVEDVELLEPGPHEVLVRWTANGVCHSDLHVMTGDYPHPCPSCSATRRPGSSRRSAPASSRSAPAITSARATFPRAASAGTASAASPRCARSATSRAGSCWTARRAFRRTARACTTSCRCPATPRTRCSRTSASSRSRKDAPLDVVCLVSCGVLAGRGAGVQPRQGAAGGERGGVGLRRRGAEHHPGRAAGGRRQDHRGGRA